MATGQIQMKRGIAPLLIKLGLHSWLLESYDDG